MEPDFERYDGPLPLFPLPNAVLLPHADLPLHVFEPRYVRLVRDAIQDRGLIGLVRLEPGFEADYHRSPAVRRIGCAGRIHDLVELPNGRFDLKLLGIRKFEILEEIRLEPYRAARIRWILDLHESAEGDAARSAVGRLTALLSQAAIARGDDDPGVVVLPGLPFVGAVNNMACAARVDPEEMQGLLELRDVYARVRRLERILTSRLDARKLADRYREFLPDDPSVN